jgi:HEAT repeat protein
MKLIKSAAVSVTVILLSLPASRGQAQSLNTALVDLRSNSYEIRSAGFSKIMRLANKGIDSSGSFRAEMRNLVAYAHRNPSVAPALIALLERENRPDPAKDNLTEDSYYGDLIGAVAELKDPRAVKALLGAITSGGMAEGGLAALGSAAVPGLLEALGSTDRPELARAAAAGVLGRVARRSDAVRDSSAIESALLHALSDKSRFVRSNAIAALGAYPSPIARHAIESIALSDTAVSDRSGMRVYPVRAAALSWLHRDDSLKLIRRPPK